MKCDDEIRCAENRLLVYSWFGVFTSIGLVAYMLLR